MTMRFLFTTGSIVTIALLSSCSSKPAPQKKEIVYTNSAEIDEWAATGTIKESRNTHSGKYVCVLDSATEYSLAFVKSISEFGDSLPDSVSFSYWIFMKKGEAGAKTVLTIDNPQKNIAYTSKPIKEKVKEMNKWIEVTESYAIPKKLGTKDILRLYVWNSPKETYLVDDFKVVFR